MANKQALIIGLGQFGMALARTLADRGVEVLAVDRSRARVQYAAAFCAEAACFDAADEESLLRTAPDRRDLCVCAIGNEARESAILVTALLRQMGAPRVVARATDDLTERILSMVGAHQIVNPERAYGQRLATGLLYEEVLEELPLGPDLLLTEIRPPDTLVGRTLAELRLQDRFGVNVIAIRRGGRGVGEALVPSPERALAGDDLMLIVSTPEAIRNLLERT
jgi:trk system potassium uptake protein TrkA